MRTTTVLRRGALFVALALLASALSCAGAPWFSVNSYDDVKRAFKGRAGIVFPDLSPLELDMSSAEYHLTRKDPTQASSPLVTYRVRGYGSLNDNRIRYDLTCFEGILECEHIPDPIIYNGVEIAHRSFSGYHEAYDVHINGFEYSLDAEFDSGKTLNETELESLRAAVKDKLYSFICGIIDAAQAS